MGIPENVYYGYKTWQPTNEELAQFYVDKTCNVDLLENEYLIIKDEEETACDIYKKKDDKLVPINHVSFKKDPLNKSTAKPIIINPRNLEQCCAFDLINDNEITVKLITGTWGTGKSFILVSGALQALKDNKFEKIIWIRNNIDVADTKDLGALPGTAFEKLEPFLGPFVDHAGKQNVKKLVEDGRLEVEPLQFLRGRNIENAIIICSESENLTREHIQLIIARCAEGSEVWFDGDTRQRDRISFENSKGLERMINSLAGEKLFGYVHLSKSERSATASLADKIL